MSGRGDGGTDRRTNGAAVGDGEGSLAGQVAASGADADTDRDPVVAVDGLSKRFGGDDGVTAVDDVSLAVERGSVVGLLGPNGAGKTTLIKSILGLVVPDAGAVRVGGVDARENPRTAYQHVDAMLEGARNDYWRLTVRENLRYFATVGGVAPEAVADRHERLLDQLELAEKADVPVRDLSRGMKQKVSLASVLAGGAEVVFLDEPTLGLDVESSRTLQRELRRLATERGLTVVLSSHDMDVIETVCDRVVIMADGEIVADDGVDELLHGTTTQGLRVVSADFDDRTLGALDEGFDVRAVEPTATATRVEVAAAGDELFAVADCLRDHGVTPDRIETVEPDLEDVFVDLTAGGGA